MANARFLILVTRKKKLILKGEGFFHYKKSCHLTQSGEFPILVLHIYIYIQHYFMVESNSHTDKDWDVIRDRLRRIKGFS